MSDSSISRLMRRCREMMGWILECRRLVQELTLMSVGWLSWEEKREAEQATQPFNLISWKILDDNDNDDLSWKITIPATNKAATEWRYGAEDQAQMAGEGRQLWRVETNWTFFVGNIKYLSNWSINGRREEETWQNLRIFHVHSATDNAMKDERVFYATKTLVDFTPIFAGTKRSHVW